MGLLGWGACGHRRVEGTAGVPLTSCCPWLSDPARSFLMAEGTVRKPLPPAALTARFPQEHTLSSGVLGVGS